MSSASYPNFAGKHAEEAIFSPADFAAYLRRTGGLEGYQAPAGVVLCYQRSLYRHVLQAEGLDPAGRRGARHGMLPLPSTGGRVGLLGQFAIGAPAAAAAVEELAAMGTPAFVSVGTAGSLQRDLSVGTWSCASPPSETRASRTTTCPRPGWPRRRPPSRPPWPPR